MPKVISGYGLYQALKDEGYELPEECADVQLVMPVDGMIQLEMRVNLTDETLAMLGRALVRMAEHNR